MAKKNAKTPPEKGQGQTEKAAEAQASTKASGKSSGKPSGKSSGQAKPQAKKAVKATQVDSGPGKLGQLKEFFDESKVEIRKVTWPTRRETITTSIAVVVVSIVVALFLGLVDMGFASLVEMILS